MNLPDSQVCAVVQVAIMQFDDVVAKMCPLPASFKSPLEPVFTFIEVIWDVDFVVSRSQAK